MLRVVGIMEVTHLVWGSRSKSLLPVIAEAWRCQAAVGDSSSAIAVVQVATRMYLQMRSARYGVSYTGFERM